MTAVLKDTKEMITEERHVGRGKKSMAWPSTNQEERLQERPTLLELDFGLPASIIVRKYIFVVYVTSLWYFVMEKPV